MKIHRIVPWLSIALFASYAQSQTILASVSGNTGQQFGSAIARYVDLDGDGLPELLVGGPGLNGGAGAVSVVSSHYLATGNGSTVLWSVLSPAPLLRFGSGIANVGDVNGDGVADFAVCCPANSTVIQSEIDIVSGATHAIIGRAGLGGSPQNIVDLSSQIAVGSDYDGDGLPDVLVGMPYYKSPFNTGSGFLVISPRQVVLNGNWLITQSATSVLGIGKSISSGDFDGDGKLDIVVGAAGAVRIYRGSNFSFWQAIPDSSGIAAGFGASIDASRDITGDGQRDILVGAPLANGSGTERGEAIVFSGAKILANTPPFDVQHWFGPNDFEHFGASVAATPDVNGDLIGDAIIGSPGRSSIFSGHEGAVTFFSGVTGENMGTLVGLIGDHLGDAVAAAWPYDGTIHFDIAAGAPQSSANATNAGALRIVAMFPAVPAFYCTSKTNSLGCTPQMSYSGSPSMTSAASFLVKATSVLNNKNGLLFYGYDANATPFQGGTLCVATPTKRTAVQSTNGNAAPNDCSGTMSFNFNSYIQSGADPALYLGRQVFTQYWSRDPSSPSTTSLTNALRFLINP